MGILGGFRALAGEGKAAVPAKDWQAFLSEFAVRDTVVRTRERALVDAIDTTTGELSADVLREVGAAFERDADPTGGRARRREGALRGRPGGVRARTTTPSWSSSRPSCPTSSTSRPSTRRCPPRARRSRRTRSHWFREPATCVSNGPFRLARWEVNKKIRLVKSRDLLGARRGRLETVDALPTENVTTALNLYLTGAGRLAARELPARPDRPAQGRPDFTANPAR